eukprot:1184827-Prorocentrum_minimum.AAC.1
MSTCKAEAIPLGPMKSHVKGGRVRSGSLRKQSAKYSSVSKHFPSSGWSSRKFHTLSRAGSHRSASRCA